MERTQSAKSLFRRKSLKSLAFWIHLCDWFIVARLQRQRKLDALHKVRHCVVKSLWTGKLVWCFLFLKRETKWFLSIIANTHLSVSQKSLYQDSGKENLLQLNLQENPSGGTFKTCAHGIVEELFTVAQFCQGSQKYTNLCVLHILHGYNVVLFFYQLFSLAQLCQRSHKYTNVFCIFIFGLKLQLPAKGIKL